MHLKKHLRGRKSLIRLFAFLCFLCAFCAFLCVKQKRQHFYAHKKHLRGRKSLVWRFVLFMYFVPFCAFYVHLSKSRLFLFFTILCFLWFSVLFCAFLCFFVLFCAFLCFLCLWNLFVKEIKLPWYPHLYYHLRLVWLVFCVRLVWQANLMKMIIYMFRIQRRMKNLVKHLRWSFLQI